MTTQQRLPGYSVYEWLAILVFLTLLVAVLYPVFSKAKEKARPNTCMSNQQQIGMAVTMYAQEHAQSLPGALRWSSGRIAGLHAKWISDLHLPGAMLKCPYSDSSMAYGITAGLAGGNLTAFPTDIYCDMLLSADAVTLGGTDPPRADGLIFSQADIDANRHADISRHPAFLASFLDGHVAYTYSSILTNAADATATPVSLRPGNILYQGADHLFVISGVQGTVEGKSFTGKVADAGRTQYFAFTYSTIPAKGQGIFIQAPGGPVTLLTPKQWKFYTICVRPTDINHKINATLKGATLTITNGN